MQTIKKHLTPIKNCVIVKITNGTGVANIMSENKTYFNSYLNRDDYEVIKTEAYRLQITTKHHISNILTDYATLKRKEIIKDSEKLMTEINNKKEGE